MIFDRNKARKIRHLKIRKRVIGTPERPRLTVFKSARNIYAQIIDDTTGSTLVSCSTLEKGIREKRGNSANKECAKIVGETIAKKALEKNISSVVFDRSGYRYHGKVKILADAAREAGLKF
ncbi:MAG: 50S ribosomal protein L18 [Candidatus Schekmanbacteria bacterium]|nr:MAG: 50S ribosomal protein L18 [Candidatus Schekmanbacteria bacterium]